MKGLKKLIFDSCGGDLFLLSCAHHGMNETPTLNHVNPYVNLDDIIGFSAESFIKREKDFENYSARVLNSSLYEIFSYTLRIGGDGLVNNRRNITPESQELYKKMNPYHREDMKSLLNLVPMEFENSLRKELIKEVKTYCRNEDDYFKKKEERGDNFGLEILPFKKKYISKLEMPDEFSRLIANYVKNYRVEMHRK